MDIIQSSDPENILALHASAVFNKKGTLIFLGPSGTGKTTICGFLNPYMEVLANDAVYLIPQGENKWCVLCGDKYAHTGTTQQFLENTVSASCIPLRAIFRLYQAEDPYLRKVDAFLTCRYLTDAFFEIVRQREEPFNVKRRTFTALAKIARSFLGYEFHFTLSSQILRVLDLEIGL
jgi:hypothetical protein